MKGIELVVQIMAIIAWFVAMYLFIVAIIEMFGMAGVIFLLIVVVLLLRG